MLEPLGLSALTVREAREELLEVEPLSLMSESSASAALALERGSQTPGTGQPDK